MQNIISTIARMNVNMKRTCDRFPSNANEMALGGEYICTNMKENI
jgi:hypothetical protein